MTWSNKQIEQWKLRQSAYLEDTASIEHNKDIDQRRLHVRNEMIQLLNTFLDGTITLKEFNAVFSISGAGHFFWIAAFLSTVITRGVRIWDAASAFVKKRLAE